MASRFVILLCIAFSSTIFAQKAKELSIILDNDLYTSPINDQYYSNGIELIYRYLGKRQTENVAKKITEFRVGQYIYTPQSVRVAEIKYHDRPFAGYLFAEAGLNTFYTNESVLKMNFQLGVVGPESGAEGLQAGLHSIVGYHKVEGWKYQITSLVGLQANAVYSHKIFRETFKEKVDFHLQGEALLGTVWTSASVGVMSRISLNKSNLKPMYDSALHNAMLSRDRNYEGRRELILFLNPNLQYQIYDATIEGSLFNDSSPVTFPLLPVRFNAEAGVKYGRNNWNFSYSFNYRGKELSNNVITGFYYGSIVLGYML